MVFRTGYFFVDFLYGVGFSVLQGLAGADFKRVASDVLTVLFFCCCRGPFRELFGDGDREREFFDFDDNDGSFMDVAVMVFIP